MMKRLTGWSCVFIAILLLTGCGDTTSDDFAWYGLSGPVKSVRIYEADVTNGGDIEEKTLTQEYTFTRDGKLELERRFNPQTGGPDWQAKYAYLDNGKTDKVEIGLPDSDSFSYQEFEYNDKGALIKIQTFSKGGELTSVREYELNNAGDKVVSATDYELPGRKKSSEVRFNENEDVLEIVNYNESAGDTRYEFEYYSRGKRKSMTWTTEYPDGESTLENIQTFDSKGWLERFVSRYNGEIADQHKYGYDDIDEHGNWLTARVRSKDEADGEYELAAIITRKIKYY